MSQNAISCGGGGGSGGESQSQPRYLGSSSSHMGGDRRRRGKTVSGGYYNNSGPRGDTRLSSTSYRGGDGGGRYSHRQSGGSGDGPHNSGSSGGGGGYRGGSDYDYQPSGGGASEGGHVRTSHSSHYQHHQYPTQQSHHHNQSHHHQGGKGGLDYESSSRGQPRGQHQHQSDHHRSTVSQQTDNCSAGQSHSGGYSGGGGGNVHHYQSPSSSEVIVVASSQPQQEHPFPSGTGGHTHVTGPFPVQGHPPPAVGIIGIHPNSQPMFGTLALCHIPYGINPSSVISPAVYTQIIGSGFVTPGLPYNYPCGFPSPMVPSHPVILQQASHPQQVQQHFHPNAYPQHHCAGGPVGGMQAQHQSNGEDCMGFDSSGVLNPDADAFFPPAFPPGNDVETEEGQRGSPSSTHNICNEPASGLETSEIKSDEDSDTPRNEDAHGEAEGIQTVTKGGDSED